jgi:hypothetical protein
MGADETQIDILIYFSIWFLAFPSAFLRANPRLFFCLADRKLIRAAHRGEYAMREEPCFSTGRWQSRGERLCAGVSFYWRLAKISFSE